jgi:phosphoribosylaminoimidazole-succinocarboxamide synthase
VKAVIETDLPYPLLARGKVRDVYDLGDRLLIVATDRLSAFDVVLPTPIPGRGVILTQMSRFWFERSDKLVPSHLISTKLSDFPEGARVPDCEGRTMLVHKAEPVIAECIVRGYISGSMWREYEKAREGSVGRVKLHGHELPDDLVESQKLPEPIFTPSTKAESGHDENISYSRLEELVGKETAARLRDLSLTIYTNAAEHALSRGVIIADTKFEFGFADDGLCLIDEALTPDSSRFWLVSEYEPGRPQRSLDKQFVRDYLYKLDWNRTPPGPALPDEVVSRTLERYRTAFSLITGEDAPM